MIGIVCQGVAVGMQSDQDIAQTHIYMQIFTVPVQIIHSHVRWELKKVDTHVEIHLFTIVQVQVFVGIHRH